MKGCGFQDTAFEASHAITLEDLVGSFQCQVGINSWGIVSLVFPKVKIHVSHSTGFDIRAGIKADGFYFYAINYRPSSEPINRP